MKRDNVIWIVKERDSGKHVDYMPTRKDARVLIYWNRYHAGFAYKPLVYVKGVIVEVR